MSPLSHSDPNSLAAAASVRGTVAAQRERVRLAIEEHGPVAEWELDEILGLSGNSTRPRLVELMAQGRIERKGKGKSPSGRSCWLYATARKPEVLVQHRAFDAPELIP